MYSDDDLETIVLLCQRQFDAAAFRKVSEQFLERVQAVEGIASRELKRRQQEQASQRLLAQS